MPVQLLTFKSLLKCFGHCARKGRQCEGGSLRCRAPASGILKFHSTDHVRVVCIQAAQWWDGLLSGPAGFPAAE